jgi:hypothetical protein
MNKIELDLVLQRPLREYRAVFLHPHSFLTGIADLSHPAHSIFAMINNAGTPFCFKGGSEQWQIKKISENKNDLDELCISARKFIDMRIIKSAKACSAALWGIPHARSRTNLIGVLLEKMGDHFTAMKHFRAAWALDPLTYRQAKS